MFFVPALNLLQIDYNFWRKAVCTAIEGSCCSLELRTYYFSVNCVLVVSCVFWKKTLNLERVIQSGLKTCEL